MHVKFLVLLSLVIFTTYADHSSTSFANETIPATTSAIPVPSPAAQDQETDEEKTKKEQQDDEAAAKQAEKIKNGRMALSKLTRDFQAARSKWSKSMRRPADRATALKADPSNEFGKKFIALADEYSGTEIAIEALKAALSRSTGKDKTIVSNRLLEMAEMEWGPNVSPDVKAKTGVLLNMLAMSGAAESKNKALNMLLEPAKADPDSDSSKKVFEQILRMRGQFAAKTEAAMLLMRLADDDISSDSSAECFAKVAAATTDETQAKALGRLLEHHVNNDNLVAVMNQMARSTPSEAAENWLKNVCRKATSSKVKGNAAIALSSYLNRRDMFRNFYGDAEESVRNKMDQNMLAYLDKAPDPNEGEMIESIMETYVKDNEKLIDKIKKQLFVIQNLSVGKTAPEITASDLDGVEFNLSDYRGKVVFLDFWGDW
ncbi:MAG: hypothetical protein P8J27_15990 [Mariniblastus sp.]|nr:hypothetical protein [Mariniblastus sp.]